MTNYQVPRGTRDIFGAGIEQQRYIENKARTLFKNWGYDEISTPLFENKDLFIRSVGETTDIVEKEMYTFQDKKGRLLALRPEGTAPVVRAIIEHNLIQQGKSTKLFYVGPMYRYERPQSGRYREFYQIGIELFGISSEYADWEVMILGYDFLQQILKDKDFSLEINSLGCDLCRAKYRDKLINVLQNYSSQVCSDCKKRLTRNPLRVLDCKVDNAKFVDLPKTVDFLCPDCKQHFENLQMLLKNSNIEFKLNSNLVRGLDYYTKNVFEIKCPGLGAQDTICAGGRYDNLVKELGGNNTPAVGLAFGIDRLLELLKSDTGHTKSVCSKIYFAVASTELLQYASFLSRKLRLDGFNIITDFYDSKSLKSQLRQANDLGIRYVLILGDEEYKNSVIQLKDMLEKNHTFIKLDSINNELKNVINQQKI